MTNPQDSKVQEPGTGRGLFSTKAAPLPPVRGDQLEEMRNELSRGRRMTAAEWHFELGLQTPSYHHLRQLGDQPVMSPRTEILLRLLQRFPHLSIVQEEYSMNEALELLCSARPERHYTLRDLSILLGAQSSLGYVWQDGIEAHPATRRLLRMLILMLRHADPRDRRTVLARYEEIVLGVGQGYGLTPGVLAEEGFSGFRARRGERDGAVENE